MTKSAPLLPAACLYSQLWDDLAEVWYGFWNEIFKYVLPSA